MGNVLSKKMVIGISTRALFDMSLENEIFETLGVEAYCAYQIAHENEPLKPGPGFLLVKALLGINERLKEQGGVEVIVMSRNSPDTSLRVFNSIKYYNLDITRAALVSGASLSPYLSAFHTDLFLSAHEDDVQNAIDSGIAAGIICTERVPQRTYACYPPQIRIAFDGDAVLFSDASEIIYKEQGLDAFTENERQFAKTPLEEGPFAQFLKKIAALKEQLGPEGELIRTALVTSRSAPAHERVIRTLRSWNVRLDEAFFLGGMEKKDFLEAFGAQIFFDDQWIHLQKTAEEIPSARVPYRQKNVNVQTRKRLYAYDAEVRRTG